ncbi:MAG: eCIS core domain-containing protein [Terriglobales bacterium]
MKKKHSRSALSIVIGGALLCLSAAGWAGCPSGYYEKSISAFNHKISSYCLPNSGTVIATVTLAGPTLAALIQASRNSAVSAASPMPPEIRALIPPGFANEAAMDRAIYKVGDNGVANLGRLVTQIGDAAAITLDDVIVFHRPEDAENPGIWVHELTHVQQYMNLGVGEFANQYVSNFRVLEDPAYGAEGNFWSFVQSQSVPPTVALPIPPAPVGFPSGALMQGCGCWGPNPVPIAPEPRCANGQVQPAACPGFCAPGQPVYGWVCR